MSCDLETVTPAGPVFRLARAPDPWAWPDWSQASRDGTFGNRRDDPEGATASPMPVRPASAHCSRRLPGSARTSPSSQGRPDCSRDGSARVARQPAHGCGRTHWNLRRHRRRRVALVGTSAPRGQSDSSRPHGHRCSRDSPHSSAWLHPGGLTAHLRMPRCRRRTARQHPRSEAAALTWADLERAGDGSGRLTIRRAKVDQEGRGAVVYIGTAALDAIEALRPDDASHEAPVFASPREPGARSARARSRGRSTAPRGGPGSAPGSRGTRPGSAWHSTSAGPGWPPTRSSRPAAGPARRWSCATPAQRAPAGARSPPSTGRSAERGGAVLGESARTRRRLNSAQGPRRIRLTRTTVSRSWRRAE